MNIRIKREIKMKHKNNIDNGNQYKSKTKNTHKMMNKE